MQGTGHYRLPAQARQAFGTPRSDRVLALGITAPKRGFAHDLAQQRASVAELHILLAEDSLVNQKLAVALLEGQGHQGHGGQQWPGGTCRRRDAAVRSGL